MLVNSADKVIHAYTKKGGKYVGTRSFTNSIEKTQYNSAVISSDGEYAVGQTKKSIIMWDITDGTIKKLIPILQPLSGLSWCPTRVLFATVDEYYGSVHLWRKMPTQKFSAYEPVFVELEDNHEYQEKETEFDVVVAKDIKGKVYDYSLWEKHLEV